MIVCAACGTSNPDDAAFCSKCARKLDAETQDAVRVQRASHTATGVRWTMVAATTVLTIIVIAAVLFVVVHGL